MKIIESTLVVIVILTGTTFGFTNDTTITYQGELKDNGDLANGSFNMEFSLWDSASAGNQFGSTIVINNVPVADGKFTVDLDFGGLAFDNDDRWLEIGVAGTTLTPRTRITRTPYAIQTRGIFVNDDESFVGIGRKNAITGSEHFGIQTPTIGTNYGGMYIRTRNALYAVAASN